MDETKHRILCSLPNTSTEINGISFEATEQGMLSEPVSPEVAAPFATIRGYRVITEEAAPSSPVPPLQSLPAPLAPTPPPPQGEGTGSDEEKRDTAENPAPPPPVVTPPSEVPSAPATAPAAAPAPASHDPKKRGNRATS